MQMANAEKRQIEPENRNANKAGDKIQDNICMLLSLRKQAAASVDIYSNGMTVNRTGQPPNRSTATHVQLLLRRAIRTTCSTIYV